MSLIHGYLLGGTKVLDRKDAGRRVRLESTEDILTNLQPGDLGTVRYYRWTEDGWGSLGVDWDSGSQLSLIEGTDSWVLL